MIPPDQQRADGVQAWLVAGPPFGGALFRDVARRLGAGAVVWPGAESGGEGGWQARGERLAEDLRGAGPVVLVAHGLGVPVALAAAALRAPTRLVLSNGPVTRLDPVTGALSALAARAPLLVAEGLLRPGVWTRWLASSAGLRRAVVNPYVMDRDTVVAITGALVGDRGGRNEVARYLASLHRGLPEARLPACPTTLAWATADPLYPPSEADYLASLGGGARHVAIPGGQWVHPIERPWALGDVIRAECDAAGRGAPS